VVCKLSALVQVLCTCRMETRTQDLIDETLWHDFIY